MKNHIFLVLIYLCFAITNSGLTQTPVKIYGKLKSVMQGDLGSKFDLKKLQDEKHIFALGAIEGLKGEITILNGKPFIASAKKDMAQIDTTFKGKAALFVYSIIEKWKEFKSSDKLGSISDIENYINQKMAKESLCDSEPIPFLIRRMVKSLSWHVIDWAEGDSVHTHKKHKTSGLHGTIENRGVTIIGFYSKKHHGIITHRTSDVHMHFVTEDKTLSGHVDEVSFDDPVLYFQD